MILNIFPILLIICCCAGDRTGKNAEPDGPEADSLFHSSFFTNTQWPSYRGYHACGFLRNADLPDSFNIEKSENVLWRLPVPGMGLSCPVIWDDYLFITTAVSEKDDFGFRTGMYGDIEPVNDSSVHEWLVYCIDRYSGEVQWKRTAHKGIPMVKRHPKSTHANTSVATDGNYVVVFFGSEGLYCYSFSGDLVWKHDFGLINSAWDVYESAEWEFSSSPLIYDGKVIIQADALNTAFVAVIDLPSGEIIWRKERDEISTWCTPNVYMNDGTAYVVVNGFRHRGGYDLETGEEQWTMSGGGDIPIPAPVIWKNLVFFNSAHGRDRPLMAIRNSATGIIPFPKNEQSLHEAIAWFDNRSGPYMTSPLVYEDLLYCLRWNGNLSCQDPSTGYLHYRKTVDPGSFIASPVAADGKIFLVQEEGTVYIIKAGNQFELIHKCSLGEVSLVTPGIAADMIIFRTAAGLIAVSETE